MEENLLEEKRRAYIRDMQEQGIQADPVADVDVAREAANLTNELIKKLRIRSNRDKWAEKVGTTLVKEAEEKVKLQREVEGSRFDQMTGMLDRYQVTEALERTIKVFQKTKEEESQNEPDDIREFAVAAPDIDLFSWWNDALQTHGVGDLLLNEVGSFFRDELKQDDIKIRTGGEEFTLIILNPGSEAKAREIAERLVRSAQLHLLDRVIEHQLVIKQERVVAESALLNGIPESTGHHYALSKVDKVNTSIRDIIQGMLALHQNREREQIDVKTGEKHSISSQSYFLDESNIKGGRVKKQIFLETIHRFFKGTLEERLSEADITSYLGDTRSYQDLSPEEREKRNLFEMLFSTKVMKALFGDVTLSLGLVYVDENFPAKSLKPKTLHRIADKRTYEAKVQGRNRVVILPQDKLP